ncbi:hypothetical protein ACFT38_00625 [Streptomyces sp. NPDC056975]|uniref:hypothetical protein n=1 Tax=Streptomyces sp. NPDC056975 TaxID=3345985 RepID=UPI003625FC80
MSQRAAPSPTQPGTRRLSAEFVEWMMGLPAGWVATTETLSRAARLHLLGNSVVPRQAAHAINPLLPEASHPTRPSGSDTLTGQEAGDNAPTAP